VGPINYRRHAMYKQTLHVLILISCASAAAVAGPLNPPAGPVGATAKPLSEIEPRIALSAENTPGDADSVFKITLDGSYYLTDEVRVPEGFSGIEVAQSCTIDLNGFSIRRDGAITNGSAVSVNTNENASVRIVNGHVRLMPTGIDGGANDDRVTIESVTFTTIDNDAINLGVDVVVRDCRFENIGGDAVQLGARASVSSCVMHTVGRSAVFVGNEGELQNILAGGCGSSTVPAVQVADNARVTGVTVRSAVGIGMRLGERTVVRDALIEGAGTNGLVTDKFLLMRDSIISASGGDGTVLGQSPQLTDCQFRNNGARGVLIATSGAGIPAAARISGCVFFFNVGENLAADRNGSPGLRESTVLDCQFNGSSGIVQLVLHQDNRLEGCHFAYGTAVQLDGSRNTVVDCSLANCDVVINTNNNFVTRNTFGGNSNLVDNGTNFAPAPTDTPTSAWDNLEQ